MVLVGAYVRLPKHDNEPTENNQTLAAYLEYLNSCDEAREKEGHEAEVMRLAMEKAQERLSEYHIFQDGVCDRVFLNHESVMLDDPEEPKDLP